MRTRSIIAPFFISFFLGGAIMAYPGTVLDHLLVEFGWTPAIFGLALLVQGACVFAGTRFFSAASLRVTGPHPSAALAHLLGLAAWALLLPAAGVFLVYYSDVWPGLWTAPTWFRLVGYGVLGLGLGGSGILNNAFALRSSDAPRNLNVLNMAFTAGAMLVPAATGGLLASLESEPAWLWRAPVGVAMLACVGLSVWCGVRARAMRALAANEGAIPLGTVHSPADSTGAASREETSAAASAEVTAPFDARTARSALVCACVVLFFYVGCEINLSNAWMSFLRTDLHLPEAAARLASPLYWAGLFVSRLYFSFRVQRGASIARHLAVFGGGVVACTAMALVLSGRSFTVPDAVVLILPLASGLFIGASYAFSLALLTHFFAPLEASRAVFTTALWGVAGSVVLPPVAGALIEAQGYAAGVAFVCVCMVIFTAAALAAVRLGRRVRKPAEAFSSV